MVANQDPMGLLPLPAAQLNVLMALITGNKHGYAIMRDVEGFTERKVTMGPGTLYGAVKQMLKVGLIEESDERPDPDLDDERRRYYRLTALGERALEAELTRMAQLVRTGRNRTAAAVRKGGTFHAVSKTL